MMKDHEKMIKGAKVNQLDNNTEVKLEGANAKIELLEKELKVRDERINQFFLVLQSIRVTVGELPRNWRSKVGAGFSPATCVENIENILSSTNVDQLDWMLAPHNQEQERGDTNADMTNKIRAEKGHRPVGDLDVSSDSASARTRGEQASKRFSDASCPK